ncbi:MAG: GNAT family N-acetyltransferase [Pseudomonadota bacterium]
MLRLDVPAIESERLILRGHRLTDFASIRDMWGDPEVTRYIGGKPRPEEDAWIKFLRASGFWVHLGYGYWIVEEKEGGHIVGEIGFGDFKRAMRPLLTGNMEAGWAFAASAHGKGYATEALRAALDWASRNFPDETIHCIIEKENAASLRVAEKCGFSYIGVADYHDAKVNVYQWSGAL